MKKKIAAVICAAAMAVPLISINADYAERDLISAVKDAVKWKNEYDNPFYSVGTNSSNLYITALNRIGEDYDYAAYLGSLDGVAAGYGSEHNAADMQRSAIAAAAAGGDAQNIGGRDLIADSTFFRGASAPLDKDGVNGYSWALIALDMGDYETPDWSISNRNQIIAALLSEQRTDGSFGGDVYSTAAAVTALAPYVETSGAYTITQTQTGDTFDLSPSEAVDNALIYLSETQMKDGDWGNLNSTAMAVIALDAVGVNCETNPYFVARNGNALDGLMSYRNKDGGFAYETKKSDGEATSYALCAMISHLAYKQGHSSIFRVMASDKVSTVMPTPVPTQRPSNSGSTSSRATAAPKKTAAPKNTMRPTRTAAPMPSGSPNPSDMTSPKPTKQPALVGPVELPGPMQPTDSPDILGGQNGSETSNAGGLTAAVISGIVLLLLAAYAALLLLNQKGLVPDGSPLLKLIPKKKKHDDRYKSKNHRKTEQHRRFDTREKYNDRLKFKKSKLR